VLLDVRGQAGLAELAADAALLDPAERHPQVQRLEGVGVDEGAAASMRRAIARPQSGSLVQTDEPRPHSLSLAQVTTCSSSS
jgi:hypothetical protein